jgi:AcrR family transcriptional regulator
MSERAYRGVSADERRGQRRAALVATVLDCLRDDGLSGVSVRSVCARSRLTARYFYESFEDLDQLLLAAVDAVVDEIAERSTSAMSSTPGGTEARVRAAIDAGFGVVADDPRKANAVLVAAAGHGPLRERRHRLVSDYADLIIDTLPALNSLGPAGRRQARATGLFLMGGSADVIEAVLSGRLAMSRVRLVDHLTTMWLGALSASLATARPGTG